MPSQPPTLTAAKSRDGWGQRAMSALVPASGVARTRVAAALIVTAALVIVGESLLATNSSVGPWLYSGHYVTGFQDLNSRLHNIEWLRSGHDIYRPFATYAFTYPPSAIFLFWPLVWIPSSQLAMWWTVISIGCLAASFSVVFWYFRRAFFWLDFAAALWIAALCVVVYPPMVDLLVNGQTGTILLLLLVLDMLIVTGRGRGVGVGVATAIKIYPGIFIVVWLWRRQWRPALTAIATVMVLTGLAWLLWPSSANTFYFHLLPNGKELGHELLKLLSREKSDSVVSFLTRPPINLSTRSSLLLHAVSLAVIAFGVTCSQRLWRQGLEIAALVALLITSVICAPVAWDHYFVFAPLFFAVAYEVGYRSVFGRVTTTAGFLLMIPWSTWRTMSSSSNWATTWEFISRNAILAACLSVLVVGLWHSVPESVERVSPLSSGPLDSMPPSNTSDHNGV